MLTALLCLLTKSRRYFHGFALAAISLCAAVPVSAVAQPIRLGIDHDVEHGGDRIVVIVNDVQNGKIGQRAGLEPGDVIELFDGEPIPSEQVLRDRLNAGPPLVMTVRKRNGQRVEVNIEAPGGGGAGPAGGFPPPIGGFGGTAKPPVATGPEYRLTNELLGSSRSLQSDAKGRLSMAKSGSNAGQRWQAVPLGSNRYRFVNSSLGPTWSLQATPGSDRPSMEPTDADSPRQVWEVISARDKYSQIVQEYEGEDWAVDTEEAGDNRPVLFRAADDSGQLWRISELAPGGDVGLVGTWAEFRTANKQPSGIQTVVQPDGSFTTLRNGAEIANGIIEFNGDRLALVHSDGEKEEYRFAINGDRVEFFTLSGSPEVFYWQAISATGPVAGDSRPRRISHEVVANPPLEPAKVIFLNTYDRELWVQVRDLRDPKALIQIKIPPGDSTEVELERDAGGAIIDRWEIPLGGGRVRVEERVTQIPPKQLYRTSVYELFVQSLAIDSTKRGKGKIEDINYSPKSVGMFPIAAGPALKDSSQIDTYEVARRQKNTGAVDRLDLDDWRGRPSRDRDPIESILRKGRG